MTELGQSSPEYPYETIGEVKRERATQTRTEEQAGQGVLFSSSRRNSSKMLWQSSKSGLDAGFQPTKLVGEACLCVIPGGRAVFSPFGPPFGRECRD
jgi:hypothetical protein